MSSGYSLPRTSGFLPTPFSRTIPMWAGAFAITWLCSYLNNKNFPTIETMSPEFKSKENIITRTEAPAVFINPISAGLPGNILGPDDIEQRG